MLLQDFRYALRTLIKQPAFFLTALFTLALGVGANTAMFSVFNGVVLKPMPYRDPDRLALIWQRDHFSKGERLWLPARTFLGIKAQAKSFECIAGSTTDVFQVTGVGDPEQIYGLKVGADLFPCLGARPLLGRLFANGEDRSGARRVVVLNNNYWLRRFGGDPNVIGRNMNLNGAPYTIIGVLPPGFKFIWDQISLWTPMVIDNADAIRTTRLYALVRPKPEVSTATANEEVKILAQRLDEHSEYLGARLVPLTDYVVRDVKAALAVLLGAVGLVLLIACANVANLLLARASGRTREIAVRSALGASRGALVRLLLVECALLGTLGGALGLVMAFWGIRLLALIRTDELPRLEEVGIDSTVLLFTLGISILTGILFGLFPARRLLNGDLNPFLREAGRSSMDSLGGRRSRNLLVVAEMALSLMLLIGGALLIQSFSSLLHMDRGFRRDNLLTFNISFPPSRYPKFAQTAHAYRAMLQRIGALPGIESVASNANLPLESHRLISMTMQVEGTPLVPEDQRPVIPCNLVSPDYFRASGVPLLAGRPFNDQDGEDSAPVIIVSASLARHYFPGKDPIGRHIIVGSPRRASSVVPREIIGLAGDVAYPTRGANASDEIYMPFVQANWWFAFVMVRSHLDPASLSASIRAAVYDLDKDQAISDMVTMSNQISILTSKERLTSVLSGAFAAIALILAAIGIYGVISYSTSQRTQEIGVRMALGAQPGDIVAWIVRQGLALAAAGAVLGLLGYLALARLLRSFLFGVSPTDLKTIAICTLTLGVIAALASYMPARRAVHIDPVSALRNE